MLNRVIYGDDILAQAKSLAIKALYIKWKTLSQLKRLTLTDFLEGDEKVRGNFIIMLATGDDYAVVYHGAEHRKALGYDISGKLISETDTRIVRALRQIYDQVREMGIPVRLIFASDGTQFAVGWERLILPIKLGSRYARPIMASTAFAHLRAMLGWCMEEELIHVHPMMFMKKPPRAAERDRILSDAEVRLAWNAEIDHTTAPVYRDILRLLILTGARRTEISDLDWKEVNRDARQLEIGRERMKAGAAHTVPLSDLALSVIMAQPSAAKRKGLVFDLNVHWGRMKVALDGQLPENMKAWVLHDLRRTTASGLQKLGILPQVIEQCLGHRVGGEKGGSIRRVYQRYDYTREKRAALDAWADHIERVLKGRASTVVALRRS